MNFVLLQKIWFQLFTKAEDPTFCETRGANKLNHTKMSVSGTKNPYDLYATRRSGTGWVLLGSVSLMGIRFVAIQHLLTKTIFILSNCNCSQFFTNDSSSICLKPDQRSYYHYTGAGFCFINLLYVNTNFGPSGYFYLLPIASFRPFFFPFSAPFHFWFYLQFIQNLPWTPKLFPFSLTASSPSY